MSRPFFAVRGLVKGYDGKTVLDGLDLDVAVGECVVILGHSGSGKSVTLRQLNGLETPEAGSVKVDGTEVVDLGERDRYPIRRRVAMLFQGGALFDSMTVFENIAFPLREHTDWPESKVEETVAAKLAMVKLAGIGEKVPAELSGGMKKRVALARSLALDPEAVLYDEPTTGLDPVTSATIAQLIRRIQTETRSTAVVVTHDLPMARTVGDRVGFLYDGRFRFLGTWEEADRTDDDMLRRFLAGEPEEEDDGT